MRAFAAFFVELDAQAQVVGRFGLAQGFVVVDFAVDVEAEQVLVEGLHAVVRGLPKARF